ncbi:MAG: cell surface protein [Alistipes sp.]|nr:cell surface protein [Alistipes senegalensis]MCM1250051.1 cell surface protein [Alistipes sp.]
MNGKYLFLLSALLLLLTGCNRDGIIEEEMPAAPEILLDSEEGIYTVKAGRTLTIAPTVRYADGARFSWTCDGKLLAASPTLSYTWEEPGEYFVRFRVATANGAAEEELRIDVLALAPPVISLALPPQGLRILQNTDCLFAPDFLNDDAEEFRIEWLRDGQVVGTQKSYTFRESQPGIYVVTVRASNIDGEAVPREIGIEVVDRMPGEAWFEPQSCVRRSTDRYAFVGTPICLRPHIGCFDRPIFRWSVDGVPVEDAAQQLFRYTPTTPGEHIVAVTVTEENAQPVRLSRNITRSATSVTAEVKVTCVDARPETRYRAATAGSSARWNKVWEFTPAPGQFVGEQQTGGFDGTETTCEAAVAYAEKRLGRNTWVSLGGWGGYLVVGFDHSIPRRAAADGEYDFTIRSNVSDSPQGGSNEPGIVWVMQDINGNGEPDDEWYELRGSETGKEETRQHWFVTYYRPAAPRMNTPWTDSEGKSGRVDYLPAYHRQDYYYPAWIAADSYTLYGTCLASNNTTDPATGLWTNGAYGWGYADNMGADNLRSESWDGSEQTNGFRIANAMYADGTPVDLQYVDFIKVQTGVNAQSGWLGENSTEVVSFEDASLAGN